MNQSLRSITQAVAEIPAEISYWANSVSDAAFYQVMIFGAVVLTFVIARSLR